MSNALRPRYLEVWLHGRHVGWLCEAGRVTRFIATEDYLTDTQRATLSLSMTLPGAEQVTQETLKNYFDPAIYRERGELPPFFAGLLPEGALRRRLPLGADLPPASLSVAGGPRPCGDSPTGWR